MWWDTRVILCACLLVNSVAAVNHLARLRRTNQLRTRSNCLEFLEYLPSSWEEGWLQKADSLTRSICDTMQQERRQAKEWLDGVASHDVPKYSAQTKRFWTPLSKVDSMSVWSFYKYRDVCSDDKQYVYVPIEPAVGLLRNPFATPCTSFDPKQNVIDVQDREYLLLASPTWTQYFPGRKLLFDLGTGTSFDSSLLWFVEKYQHLGVQFDEIWSWEARDTNPHAYWQTVPDKWVSKLHFYNTFATEHTNLSAPLGMILDQYKAGDFVVVKLDIDNEELESIIVRGLLDIAHVLGELFFEKHFDAPEMRPYFGDGLSTDLTGTLQMFRQYRSAGVRLHYWP
ncbi:TPA: hypothetical protein ACH3X3_004933 [Trebouxia sp. C0006]